MLKPIKSTIFLILCFLLSTNQTSGQTDNSNVFSYADYLLNVIDYHPIARKADLNLKLGQIEWLSARGTLDPNISSDFDEKRLKDLLYYRVFESKLKIPTLLGLQFVGSYKDAEGTFLNPQFTTDRNGIWEVGIEVDVLQGLLVNERTTALKQAKTFDEINKNQQQILLNNLLYSASVGYLDWQQSYYLLSVFTANKEIAKSFLEITKASFLGGEKSKIDTLEASVALQEIEIREQSAKANYEKSKQNLENFLWFNNVPIELTILSKPEQLSKNIFRLLNSFTPQELVEDNPLILEKINKRSFLENEQRLNREKLKPKLKAILKPQLTTSINDISPNYDPDDYVFGFNFSTPLFIRSARAEVKRGDIKIQEIGLDILNKKNELLNKIENSLLQIEILKDQIVLQSSNTEGYKKLLEGENEKFKFGESSVFLLNKRQEKYIESQIKLIKLKTKQQKEILNYLYFTNQMLAK